MQRNTSHYGLAIARDARRATILSIETPWTRTKQMMIILSQKIYETQSNGTNMSPHLFETHKSDSQSTLRRNDNNTGTNGLTQGHIVRMHVPWAEVQSMQNLPSRRKV